MCGKQLMHGTLIYGINVFKLKHLSRKMWLERQMWGKKSQSVTRCTKVGKSTPNKWFFWKRVCQFLVQWRSTVLRQEDDDDARQSRSRHLRLVLDTAAKYRLHHNQMWSAALFIYLQPPITLLSPLCCMKGIKYIVCAQLLHHFFTLFPSLSCFTHLSGTFSLLSLGGDQCSKVITTNPE